MKATVAPLFALLACPSSKFFTAGFTVSHSSMHVVTTTAQPTSSILFSVENDDDIQGEMEPSPARKTRMAWESELSKRFATGEDLKNLRLDLESLRHNLQWAEALKDEVRMESLEKAIQRGEKKDPDLMYKKAIKMISQARKMKDASSEERDALIEKWAKMAAAARKCLPQFNLEGLWVGK